MISEICSLGLSDEELSRWYDDDLPAARIVVIHAHSATCPACRKRLAAFAEIGAGLRDLTPPPLDLARLLAGLPESPPASTPISTPIPSETLRYTHRRSWRALAGAAGLAAVLVLSLFAGYIFTNHGRTRPGAVATATSSSLFSRSELPLTASVIAMSSPSNGWAFASQEIESNSSVIALHYTGGKWTRVKTDVRGRVMALTMRNANDGWLVGTNIYHYDGRSWKELAVPQHADNTLFASVAISAPSSVWISVADTPNPMVLHYDGTGWAYQQLPPPSSLQSGGYYISSFAMTSEQAGWALTAGYGASGDTGPSETALLRYSGGVWQVDRTCTDCNLAAISLAGASDGWVGGGYSIPQGDNLVSVKPLLWRLSNGVWKDVPLPDTSTTDGKAPDNFILAMHMLSETQGWLITASVPPNDVYHLENGRWVGVPGVMMPNPFNASAFAFVSPNEFWAIGLYGLSHYVNGDWRNVGSPPMP